MNYKKEYKKLKAKVNLIKLTGLAIAYAGIFVYWIVR